MNINIQSLLDSADSWEKYGYAASAVVVIGILIESFELSAYIRAGKLREKRFELIGLLILILGLAGEVLTQVQSNNRTGLVIGALSAKASEANKVANEAASRAADLGVKVDELPAFVAQKKKEISGQIDDLKSFAEDQKRQRDAVFASLNIAQAKAATSLASIRADERALTASINTINELRQKLHDLTTDRVLSSEQVADAIKQLRPLDKVLFDMSANHDEESLKFALQIGRTLRLASWAWESRTTLDSLVPPAEEKVPILGGAVTRGLHIEVCDKDKTSLAPAVFALVKVLSDDGYPVTKYLLADEDAAKRAEPCGKMHIFVGSKP